MLKVMVIGALGRMGRAVCGAVGAEDDMTLSAAVDPAFSDPKARDDFGIGGVPAYEGLEECLEAEGADVAVDFTNPSTVFDHVMACLERGIHCVVGTTGLGEEQLEEIERKARSAGANCFIAPNFAIGAVLMMEAARMIVRHLPAAEIIELHHDQKLDAPSGTALRTADLMAGERPEAEAPPGPEGNPARGMVHDGIPIHSVRLPGLIAHQEVVFGGRGQSLSIRHDSITRDSFMPG
ncbi:MAG: 4-hydroxy-tetrahydrodipicolinate reductase, partial [Thermoleophilia bacterium]|nr:4-hydroxy-tetrahydrodipicolinate reductase [Thermoleophilia bacterium]